MITIRITWKTIEGHEYSKEWREAEKIDAVFAWRDTKKSSRCVWGELAEIDDHNGHGAEDVRIVENFTKEADGQKTGDSCQKTEKSG